VEVVLQAQQDLRDLCGGILIPRFPVVLPSIEQLSVKAEQRMHDLHRGKVTKLCAPCLPQRLLVNSSWH